MRKEKNISKYFRGKKPVTFCWDIAGKKNIMLFKLVILIIVRMRTDQYLDSNETWKKEPWGEVLKAHEGGNAI